MNSEFQKYRMICTLQFGDIYGQIIIWLMFIFITLASAFGLWSSTRQAYALAVVGMVVLISLPFLLFAFVTTLFNHLEFVPMEEAEKSRKSSSRKAAMAGNPAEATS
jgi:hypothetical protein